MSDSEILSILRKMESARKAQGKEFDVLPMLATFIADLHPVVQPDLLHTLDMTNSMLR